MPAKEKINAEEIGAILGQQPMSAVLMTRVCDRLSKLTRTKTICLDGPLPRNMRFGRRRHIFILLVDQERWVCCYNDGKQTLTEYNTNEETDTADLSARLLRAYNMQPLELKQAIVKSEVPLPSSDVDSGFLCAATAALVGKRRTIPSDFNTNVLRQNLVKMLYRGKLNGFPDYSEPTGCGGGVKQDDALFVSLFTAFDFLNESAPQVFSSISEPRPSARRSSVAPFYALPRIQEPKVQLQRKDDRLQAISPRVELAADDDDMEQALGLPNAPVDGRRVIKYEKGPNSAAISIATAGMSEDRNIRFIQYERVTKEIHYMKPKSDRS